MAYRLLSRLFALCASLASTLAFAQAWQPLDSIRAAAAEHARAHLAAGGTHSAVEAGALDARLRLAACAAPLEASSPANAWRGANATVAVACAAPQPWKIYVPVRIERSDRVLVTRRPLARDTVLTTADVVLAERDAQALPQGYLTDPLAAEGRRLRRALPAGAVVMPSMLDAVPVIARGQGVTLEAEADGMRIRMAGEALADGGIGERVRVRNASSERVVEGIVRSGEVVEVPLR
jgi:flagellar basal body P-ring formation protein FlgA